MVRVRIVSAVFKCAWSFGAVIAGFTCCVSISTTDIVWVSRLSWFQNEVDVGPVQAQFGSMASIDLDFTVRNNLLDERGDFVDDHVLDRINLTHNALDALLKQDDLIV